MELYLSRLHLNHRLRLVMKDVEDPRMLHRTISSCFPAIEGQAGQPQHMRETPRSRFNILHRLERRRDGFVLYVQSTVKPDWSLLKPRYANRIDVKPVNGLYSNINNGMRLIFRLAANPTKRAGKSDTGNQRFQDEKRRRIDIRTEENRIAWLEKKGEKCGFRLCRVSVNKDVASVDVSPGAALRFKHDTGYITLGSAVFTGVLEVTEAETFRAALVKGIGSGKAYGFGLMSIAPA